MTSEPGAVSAEGVAEAGIPWQRREELGSVVALLQTVKLFAISPVTAFARVRPECGRGLSGALLFGIVVGTLAILLNILGVAVFGSVALFDLPPHVKEVFGLSVAGRSLEWIPLLLALVTGSFVGMLVAVAVFPPIFVLGLFLWTAVLHLSLRVVGGVQSSEAGFQGTFAVAAYSSLAFLVHLIPVLGDLLATLWAISLHTIGLATVHRTTRMRAFVSILLPPIVLVGVFAITALATRVFPGG